MQHRDRTFRFSVLLRLFLASLLASIPLFTLPWTPTATAQGAINLPYGFILAPRAGIARNGEGASNLLAELPPGPYPGR